MKKTWLLAVITAILLVVTGCGKEEAKPSQVNSDSSQPLTPLTLDTEVAYDPSANALSTTVTMTNPNDEAVDVTFNSSQRYQLIIKQGDETVFDYGSEFMFTESIVEETWTADEQKIFDEVFLLDELEAGEYSVEVIGLGQVADAPEMAVTDETTFTVERETVEPEADTTEKSEEKSEATAAPEPQTDGAFRDVKIDFNDTMIQVSGFTEVVEFEWSISDGHNFYAQGAFEVTGGDFTFAALVDKASVKDKTLFLEMTPVGGEVASFNIQ